MSASQQQTPPRPLSIGYRTLLSVVRHTPLRRGLARRKILPIFTNTIKHPVMTDFRGVPIILRFDNTTECKALFGYYDLKELRFMKDGCAHDDPVFVDIGANCGFYTQNFLALGKGRALAIEPNPTMHMRIKENYDHIKAVSKTTVGALDIIDCCVGDTISDAHLNLSSGYGAAHVTNDKNAQTIPVTVRPLTDILKENDMDRIDVLKIDVEGYEDRALMPFFKSAPESLWPKRIIIEHTSEGEWQDDLLAVLKACRYREIEKTRGNLLLERQ